MSQEEVGLVRPLRPGNHRSFILNEHGSALDVFWTRKTELGARAKREEKAKTDFRKKAKEAKRSGTR